MSAAYKVLLSPLSLTLSVIITAVQNIDTYSLQIRSVCVSHCPRDNASSVGRSRAVCANTGRTLFTWANTDQGHRDYPYWPLNSLYSGKRSRKQCSVGFYSPS
ncbi:hypothetical protein PoB_007058700 [Plakobranchus ocellatus]|uniref:Secreted protein n=1 Tax=Plakobranchus ocellatus TaxID=259542 RepID=A0AAV4DII9_9GAST|nr:hypothetical protein PoB_007058700 [Plakobranchus ocellatus]